MKTFSFSFLFLLYRRQNFGKHSELLTITNDPKSYVSEEIRKVNEEYHVGKVTFNLIAGFNEKVKCTDLDASVSYWVNIGYFFLLNVIKRLNQST